ncbi:hypothetical protein C4X14_001271 [Salmonella enterica subsp. enterica serovar Javiana]|nr:hypothetical protein [Salmonella enterica subsp. enterica serovar Javiana]
MKTNNHPAHGPVSLDRLHQISEILSKAAAQSDGGNLGYAMADAVKVIDGVLNAEPVAYIGQRMLEDLADGARSCGRVWSVVTDEMSGESRIPLYAAPPAPVVDADDNFYSWFGREWEQYYQPNNYSLSAKKHLGAIAESAWFACRAAMLQAEPVSNSDELPLDYLQGHKDGLEWAAQLAEANHPQTGDWLYDDPIDLARAIRKGPDMPTVQGGNSPVIPDDVRRMDWLVSKTVDVREPMVYGSHSLFWSQTITDEEDDYHATKLREQIDAAMAAEQAAAPQQEVKTALEHGMQRYAGAMQKLSEGDK